MFRTPNYLLITWMFCPSCSCMQKQQQVTLDQPQESPDRAKF